MTTREIAKKEKLRRTQFSRNVAIGTNGTVRALNTVLDLDGNEYHRPYILKTQTNTKIKKA